MLDDLPIWSSSKDFDHSDWAKYIQVAKVFASAEKDTVVKALKGYSAYAASQPRPENGGKRITVVVILLRVMFQLPENEKAGKRVIIHYWVGTPEADHHGCVNHCWPIVWRDGNPKLTGLYGGSAGKQYEPHFEYLYYLDTYPIRNEIKKATSPRADAPRQ